MNRNFLLNPFDKIAGQQALLYGLIIMLVSAFLSILFNARFDGILDLHFTNVSPGWKVALLDQGVNIVSLFIAFFIVARLFGAKHTRWIDIIGTFALARAPYMLLPLLNFNNKLGGYGERVFELISSTNYEDLNPADFFEWWMIPYFLILFLGLVWMIILYFQAFKISTNLKGNQLIFSFIIGIFAAELISKLLIISLT